MKLRIKIFHYVIFLLLLINIIVIKTGKNNFLNKNLDKKIRYRSFSKQSPYVTLTVDPRKVEADDVGTFRVVNVPVTRSLSAPPIVTNNVGPLVTNTVQTPIGIPTTPFTNLHHRSYLPNSDPIIPVPVIKSINFLLNNQTL
jgi:hypothetical protein